MSDSTKKGDLFIFLCTIILGFLYVNFVVFGALSIDAAIFSLLFISLQLIYVIYKKVRLKNISFVFLLISILSAINFIIYSNVALKYINFLFISFMAVYWLYFACGMSLKSKISSLFIFDLIRMFIVIPFSNFISGPAIMTKTTKKAKIAKSVFLVILGLIITLPVTVVVIGLLASADAQFANIWNYISKAIFKNMFSYVVQFIVSIPVSLYLFAIFNGFINKSYNDTLNENEATKITSTLKFVPRLLSYTAILPLCLVYVMFIATQVQYYFSAFYNKLPENYNYSEFARRGFFELCIVATINLCVILTIVIFTKRKEGMAKSNVFSTYIIIFSLFTLILIATALSKMLMYIQAYGLTLLRVYTSWFMIALAITFLLIIVKQLFNKFNLAGTLLITCSIWFLILIFSNVDGIIVKYNIDQYQNGNLKTIDVNMTKELSDSAIPYIVQLLDDKDPVVQEQVKEILKERKKQLNATKNRWRNYNLSSYKVRSIVNGLNL